jgi:hypothetical protein
MKNKFKNVTEKFKQTTLERKTPHPPPHREKERGFLLFSLPFQRGFLQHKDDSTILRRWSWNWSCCIRNTARSRIFLYNIFIPVLYTHHPRTLPKTPNKLDLSSS